MTEQSTRNATKAPDRGRSPVRRDREPDAGRQGLAVGFSTGVGQRIDSARSARDALARQAKLGQNLVSMLAEQRGGPVPSG
jgi:hypothetical protein